MKIEADVQVGTLQCDHPLKPGLSLCMHGKRTQACRDHRRVVLLKNDNASWLESHGKRTESQNRIRLIHQYTPADDRVEIIHCFGQVEQIGIDEARLAIALATGSLSRDGKCVFAAIDTNYLPAFSNKSGSEKRHVPRAAADIEDPHIRAYAGFVEKPFSKIRLTGCHENSLLMSWPIS